MTRWHWKEYAIEAAGLGVFLLAACAFTVFIEHAQSRASALEPWVRRALMGAAMGLTAAALKSLMNRQRACAIHGRECHQGLFARNLYVGQRSPLAGVRARSAHLGPGPALQGARGGEPLCGGRLVLPLFGRREPGADHHGQCAPRRRPPRAAALSETRIVSPGF